MNKKAFNLKDFLINYGVILIIVIALMIEIEIVIEIVIKIEVISIQDIEIQNLVIVALQGIIDKGIVPVHLLIHIQNLLKKGPNLIQNHHILDRTNWILKKIQIFLQI